MIMSTWHNWKLRLGRVTCPRSRGEANAGEGCGDSTEFFPCLWVLVPGDLGRSLCTESVGQNVISFSQPMPREPTVPGRASQQRRG